MPVLEHHAVLRHAPDLGGAPAQLGDRLAGGIDDDHAAGEQTVRLPAVTMLKPSALVSAMTARTLSTGMPSSSAAIMLIDMREPATSGCSEQKRDRSVGSDGQRARGLAAAVEPEAEADAASLIGAERRVVVLGLLGRLQGLDHADRPERLAVDRDAALPRRILEAQIDRIHAELLGQLVDHAFGGENRLRHAGGAECIHLRPVRHHLVGDRLGVLQVVAGEHRLRRVEEHRAGERARSGRPSRLPPR